MDWNYNLSNNLGLVSWKIYIPMLVWQKKISSQSNNTFHQGKSIETAHQCTVWVAVMPGVNGHTLGCMCAHVHAHTHAHTHTKIHSGKNRKK